MGARRPRNDSAEPTPPPPLPAELPEPPGSHSLQGLVVQSLLAGLCPLIPLPFLDDWARDLLRERLTASLARRHGLDPSPAQVVALTGTDKAVTALGCLRSMLFGTFFYLVKKLFRKVLFFLTIKDCVDTFARTFQEAYLLRHAFAHHRLGSEAGESEQVRSAIVAVSKQVDPRPVEKLARQALAGSRGLLRRTARRLGRLLRPLRRSGPATREHIYEDLELRPEEERLAEISREITAGLEQESSYFRRLETCLDAHLRSLPEDPESSPSAHGA